MYYHQPIYPREPRHLRQSGRKIVVNGEGRVAITPDIARILIGVETENIQLKKAQEETAQKIANITDALPEFGIKDEQIQTSSFTIYPLYEFINGQQNFRGYRVEHTLQITTEDISQVGPIVDKAIENGANRVSNISFHIADSARAYEKALELAVKDAIQKAKTIAQTLQIRLNPTPIKTVEETKSQNSITPYQESQMVKAATTQMQPGQEEIRARVTATFVTVDNS